MFRFRSASLVAVVALAVALLAPPAAAVAAEGYTGTISVQLTTMSGKPLALEGAIVSGGGDGWEAGGGATDATGRFQLGIVPVGAGGGVQVQLPQGTRYAGFATGIVPATLAEGELYTVKVRVPIGASISGTVRNTAGTPLAAVEVRLLTSLGGTYATTVTDSRGKYRFIGLPTVRVWVQFNARGETPWEKPVITKYGWLFWKGAVTWPDSDGLKIKQQTTSSAATAKTGINASLPKGYSLRATVNGTLPGSTVYIVGSSQPTSFTYRVDDAGAAFSVRLNRGSYRIQIVGPDGVNAFWYTGNSTPASYYEVDAKTISFSGTANKNVTFTFPAP